MLKLMFEIHLGEMPEAFQFNTATVFLFNTCAHEKIGSITHFPLYMSYFFQDLKSSLHVRSLHNYLSLPYAHRQPESREQVLIIKTCQNKVIVSIETRRRVAVAFVRHHRIDQSGEENPGLLKATHVDFILKGKGMEK